MRQHFPVQKALSRLTTTKLIKKPNIQMYEK